MFYGIEHGVLARPNPSMDSIQPNNAIFQSLDWRFWDDRSICEISSFNRPRAVPKYFGASNRMQPFCSKNTGQLETDNWQKLTISANDDIRVNSFLRSKENRSSQDIHWSDLCI